MSAAGGSRDRDTTVILRTVARVVLPLILLTAVSLLLRGHNLPGGGFVAGVLTATAFAVLYMAYGIEYVESELLDRRPTVAGLAGSGLITEYRLLFGIGLGLAAGSGLVAVAFGHPFLSQTILFVHDLPVYHELEVPTAFVFDLGVYVAVVGALLTVLAAVGIE